MPIPIWVSGQDLSAADVNNWFVPLSAVKGSDQPVTSSVSLVSDSALVLAVPANVTYEFRCLLIVTGASGGDFKWTWAVPSGAVLLYQCLHNEGGATGLSNSALVNTDSFTGIVACAGTSTNEGASMWGTFTVKSTPGNLQLRWAQNTSNATATTVRTGSYLNLRRIG